MNKYVEIKIIKKYLVMIGIVFLLICGIGGYYVWYSYHPEVIIKISDGPTGKEGIKIEAPHISVLPTGIAEPAASIELKANIMIMQHESLCAYIKDNYEESNILLDIELKDNQTILKYHGTVTDSSLKTTDFHRELNCDYGIDAKIENKR